MNKAACTILAVLTSLGFFGPGTGKMLAQGGHYWTEQYGTRSILMSGSVIGGVEDLGAVYYNPGRLAIIENPAFLLSAKLYQLEKLTVLNAIDDDNSLKNSTFGGVPGLVAGTFRIGFLPKHHFAYSMLTRKRSDYAFTTRTSKEGDLFDGLPGGEVFSGKLTLATRFTDEWMSLTWSYPLKENLSIGVTSAYVSTGSSKNFDMKLQLLYDDNTGVGQLQRTRTIDFSDNGLLWKFGLAWKTKYMDLGLTATTPKIHLRGSGNFTFEDYLSGLPDTVGNNHFESSIQGNLKARSRSPFSVGGGTTFKLFRKHQFHVSGEYYHRIPRYDIIDIQAFTGQSTGEEIDYIFYDEARPVFNYGMGLELTFTEVLSMYLSYSSDHSSVPTDIKRLLSFSNESANSTFRADINHAGAGFILKLKRADITLGTTAAWSTESIPRPIDFPDQGEDGIFDSNETADIRWSRWRFIFSFSFPFLKDIQTKVEDKLSGGDQDE
jgi:hypothetical protein